MLILLVIDFPIHIKASPITSNPGMKEENQKDTKQWGKLENA